MNLSLVAIALWAAGSLLNVTLVFVLLYKRRYRVVPWFTTWMSYELLYALACFSVYRLGSKASYRLVYWIGALIDFFLQIAVVGEIARCVLKRGGHWVEGARVAVMPFVIAGPVVAAMFAGLMTPAARNTLNALAARASLFSTVLICFLFVAVIRASQRLGLDWRSHVARESLGLTVWTLVAFITDTLHAYWRTMSHFQDLENLRIFVFQGALLFWCVAFWFPEFDSPNMPTTPLKDYKERLGG
ncbi:MAG: hypothetical protein ACRYGF_15470 [Janthinobacterium lividum]